ncbi:MAG: amino acid carrier protein [Parabacteroides sp.]|nr:amino acid carrier protein [Parabacteroides sp.]
MERFLEINAAITTWIWGPPILILFMGTFVFMTIFTGFVQFKYVKQILRGTFGKMFGKKEGDGTVSAFQAATTALGATVGASNMLGVPIAIAMGGPGAVFWMWIAALFGVGMKYSEIVLSVKYRFINEEGVYTGGPAYYLSKGLGKKWVGSFYAIMLILFLATSIPTQTVAVVDTASTLGIPGIITALVMAALVCLVVYGGITRIAKVSEFLVPFMALSYLIIAWIIIALNITALPACIGVIFKSAFTPTAALGGFGGAGIVAGMRWGMARGIYSNEAGLGEFTIAHAAATTDHPCRQAAWGIFEVIVDTLIICTTSAFLALTTGLWTATDAAHASTIPTLAVQGLLGEKFGSVVMTVMILLFAFTTILVGIHYGSKQSEYLFGVKAVKYVVAFYVATILAGALGKMAFFFNFVDIFLALVVLPNVIGVCIMHKQVKEQIDDFYGNPKYFPELQNKKNKK